MDKLKFFILLVGLMTVAQITARAQLFNFYRHKSEAKIQQMTPAQRVDEWIKEQMNHQSSAHNFDVDDKQNDLIKKYIYLDKLKPIPRIVEIIKSFDASRKKKNKRSTLERFELAIDLIRFIDCFSIRIRSSDEGMPAIRALEDSIKRMRAAGFVTVKEQPGLIDQDEWMWEWESLLWGAEWQFGDTSGVNLRDQHIRDTLRFVYKITVSDSVLLDFSNFLTERYPEYPSWSTGLLTKDPSTLGPGGYPVQIIVLKQPERYREAYLEFKKGESSKE